MKIIKGKNLKHGDIFMPLAEDRILVCLKKLADDSYGFMQLDYTHVWDNLDPRHPRGYGEKDLILIGKLDIFVQPLMEAVDEFRLTNNTR